MVALRSGILISAISREPDPPVSVPTGLRCGSEPLMITSFSLVKGTYAGGTQVNDLSSYTSLDRDDGAGLVATSGRWCLAKLHAPSLPALP